MNVYSWQVRKQAKILSQQSEILQKHKTTHADVKFDHCGKRFTAKRNLRRHIMKKHPIQDDPISDMVDRAEIVIQH